MRRVDVEEPAAVRAELLDRNLRRGRAHRQRLRRRLLVPSAAGDRLQHVRRLDTA